MFNKKREREEEELRDILRNGWQTDSEEERTEFLKRLKIVLPPDHPGLLCLQGKARKMNGNGFGAKNEISWRRKRMASFVATWSFILVVVFVSIFGIHNLLYTPPGVIDNPDAAGNGGIALPGANGQIKKEVELKFIYKFEGITISRSSRLSMEQLNIQMNLAAPKDIVINITGMDETESYEEETDEFKYKVTVYELEGSMGRKMIPEYEPELPDMQ